MLIHLQPEGAQLCIDHGRERILDAPMEHLRARRHHADLHLLIRQNPQHRLSARRLTHPLHHRLVDDERDHAHPCELCPRLDRHVLRNRRNHDILDVVDGIERILVHLEHTCRRRGQLYLALARLTCRHVLILTDITQDRRRIVLMQQIRIVLPDKDMLFANAQKNGNILRTDHIALAEACALSLPAHNLCNVVAEHHPHRILNTNLTHTALPA